MVIHGVYIVSKSGGLIFNHDNNIPKVETEKVFNYPIDLRLDIDAKKISVAFGQKDGINGEKEALVQPEIKSNQQKIKPLYFIFASVGHVLTSINGVAVNGSTLEDGRNAKDILENASEFPLTLKFTRPKMTTNEKIFLASMFYPLFAIASQLSPEPKSSGIEILEADTFKLQCFQTLTGTVEAYIFQQTLCRCRLCIK